MPFIFHRYYFLLSDWLNFEARIDALELIYDESVIEMNTYEMTVIEFLKALSLGHNGYYTITLNRSGLLHLS